VKFGYRFNRHFSLEGGYTDLGDFSSSGPVACVAQVGVPCDPVNLDLSMQGIMVNAVGTWPVSEHIVLSASAGVIYRQLDTRYTDPAGNRSSNSDEDSVTKFGVGVAFPINERFEVGLDFTAYRDVGVGIASSNSSTDFYAVNDGEANVFSLGMRWRF
jgi:OmpA-OmpF porin, OOP family